MIGTSFPALVAIRTSITLLRAIAPLSIIYTVSLPFLPSRFLTPSVKILSIYPICESAFYFLVYLPWKHKLQAAAEHPPLRPPEERRALIQKISQTVPDHTSYLKRWFLNAKLEDIKVDNVKEFLRWCLFNSSGSWSEGTADVADEDELDEYVSILEKNLGRKLEEGRGPAQCYRLTIDEVRVKHRPLIWYFILSCLDLLTYVRLSVGGFKYYRLPLSEFPHNFPFRLETLAATRTAPGSIIPYWYRSHKSKTETPIIFIHGIGVGLHPYVPMFKRLAKTSPDVGIIVVEINTISSRICRRMPKKEVMVDEIRKVLANHPEFDDGLVLVANSYGSVIATHLLHDTDDISNRITSLFLIDPVTLLLHLPDVAYNFLRRQPVKANEHMLHYYSSTDPGVAHTLCRRFFWAENILWKEDLEGRNVSVWLGERDLIVDTAAVRRYLTGEYRDEPGVGGENTLAEFKDGEWTQEDKKGGKLKVVWGDGLDHAQVFDEKKWYTRLVGDILQAVEAERPNHLDGA